MPAQINRRLHFLQEGNAASKAFSNHDATLLLVKKAFPNNTATLVLQGRKINMHDDISSVLSIVCEHRVIIQGIYCYCALGMECIKETTPESVPF